MLLDGHPAFDRILELLDHGAGLPEIFLVALDAKPAVPRRHAHGEPGLELAEELFVSPIHRLQRAGVFKFQRKILHEELFVGVNNRPPRAFLRRLVHRDDGVVGAGF